MLSRIRALSRVAALAACAQAAHALDPSLAVTQYVQSVWRAPRDLPHDNVTAIVQTRDGYLWVGTVEGLARFDGVRSVVFNKGNTPQIRNNWIRALLEDRDGRLWIGTFGGGLVCLEQGRFVAYDAAHGLAADVVLALAEDEGRVLVGTHGAGVLRFEGGRFVREPGTEEIATSSVRAFARDERGALWLGTEDGLFRREAAGAPLVRQAGLPSEIVSSLAALDGALYVGTERGLARVADGAVTAFTMRDGLSHHRIWTLATDSDRNLWIGTDGGGLDRLAGGRITSFSTRNGLTNDYVWALLEDREKSLWVGTNGGGLNQLRRGRLVPLTTREGLPSDFVWGALRTREGSLLVATEERGVAQVRDGAVSSFVPFEAVRDRVRALLEDTQGRIWIGADSGLFRHEGGRLRAIPFPGRSPRVTALAEDPSGTIWVGCDAGLWTVDGDRPQDAVAGTGLPPPSVTMLMVARDGTLWVAFTTGIWHRRGGGFVAYSKDQGLPSQYVTTVLEAPDGAIWAATRGGLARLREARFQAVTSRQGLPDDAVMSALLADDGGLWLGGNRGLFRVPLAELEGVLAGHGAPHARAFGLDEGMRSLELNHGGSARMKDASGTLWFATRVGLVSVPPVSAEPPLPPPPVRIEEALVDGRALEGPPPWRLPAGTLRLGIHFTALSFRSPSEVRLRHRLDGFDTTWVAAGPGRTAHYTNLPHGRYRLQVAAASADGTWGDAVAVAEIEIAPRVYETFWFRALAAVVFLLAGPLFYFARVRLLRRQKADLERLVAERTAEVAAANERLAQLVREDVLTGVASRRRFEEALEEEWRRALRLRMPLTLALVDVDWFKAFNDRLGHPAGDACLRSVAAAVASVSQRAGDLVARYGGEEFALLLPGIELEGARAVAESVRQRVERLAIAHPDSKAAVVTVSVGVASCSPASWPGIATDLVSEADRALYAAKQAGRNRVEVVS
ncbi:MAG TPA: two-component regulator propeller domain-containing protein [Vicinamibacteria bacterium]|nr:two-component regulator propeller domain-containing protein [Vicinamibacteria bacterium]